MVSQDDLTTSIVVDQERMGANVRSTVATITEANAYLRTLFPQLAEPHAGGPGAYSFNVPSVSGSGAITVERGAKTIAERPVTRGWAACALAARAWARSPTWTSPSCTTRTSPSRTGDRKSTRLNSSHVAISYAVFCLKKKKPELWTNVITCSLRMW